MTIFQSLRFSTRVHLMFAIVAGSLFAVRPLMAQHVLSYPPSEGRLGVLCGTASTRETGSSSPAFSEQLIDRLGRYPSLSGGFMSGSLRFDSSQTSTPIEVSFSGARTQFRNNGEAVLAGYGRKFFTPSQLKSSLEAAPGEFSVSSPTQGTFWVVRMKASPSPVDTRAYEVVFGASETQDVTITTCARRNFTSGPYLISTLHSFMPKGEGAIHLIQRDGDQPSVTLTISPK